MAFRLLPGGRRIAGSRETLFANGVRRRGHVVRTSRLCCSTGKGRYE